MRKKPSSSHMRAALPKPAIQQLLDSKPDSAKVDKFLTNRTIPIVEGPTATFVWRGEANRVTLRHWIFGLEAGSELTRIPNTDLWYLTLDIPHGSRVEYKFEVHRNDRSEWIEDPRNPNRARDPFGANSVLQGEGYAVPDWVRPDPTSRPGLLEPFGFHSRAFGGMRTGHIYLPARFRKSRLYPLLVVHDGSDYLNFAVMKTVLDNLIERLEIPDVIVAFTDSPNRILEYPNYEPHARFLTEELLKDLTSRLPIIDRPQARCLMGASFGAVAAFSTAYRYPGVWGRLLLQSGSFAFTDIGKTNRRGPLFDKVVEFVNQLRANPVAVSERIFMSCGVYESLIYENRSLLPLLDSTGMQVKLVESRDGHNWENWRDRLREGLSWLFPGPLMFIYE